MKKLIIAILACAGLYLVLALMHALPDGINVFASKDAQPVASAVTQETVSAQPQQNKEEEVKPAEFKVSALEVATYAQKYVLPNGKTLKQAIEAKHPAVSANDISWNIASTPNDPILYPVMVHVKLNPQGEKLTYRFVYNASLKTLTPQAGPAEQLVREASH